VDSRVFGQGVRNINDTINLFNVAEGGVQQLEKIITRISELAEQSSNGTLGSPQRASLNSEANALVAEYHRIVSTTSLNGQNLLDGTLKTISTQTGYGDSGSLVLALADLSGAKGDGTFQAPTNYYTNGSVGSPFDDSLHAVDVNGDGKLDLALANDSQGFDILIGNGDGTFKAPQSNSNGFIAATFALSTGDVNGDGKLDIISGDYGTGRIFIALGNGDGTFKSGLLNYAGGDPTSVVTADINGDGKLDVVSQLYPGRVSILLGNGDGTFNAETNYTDGGAYFLRTADVNGDGKLDIISADYGSNAVSVLVGNGNGTFRARQSFVVPGAATSVNIADVDGDGKLDVVADGSSISLLLGNGDGTFSAARNVYSGGSNAVTLADLNGDGSIDIVDVDGSQLNVLFSNGNGTFQAPVSSAPGSGQTSPTAVDLNADGILDIVTAGVTVSLGKGSAGVSLSNVDLTTASSSLQVLDNMKSALATLTSTIGLIGAGESRLQTAVSDLSQVRQNVDSAVSTIRDVDVATESSELIRETILQQADAAILAQANQQPAVALKLLQF
jgi:flagellin-like hook-associated protein FlgL